MSATREWIRTQKARINSEIHAINDRIDKVTAELSALRAEKQECQNQLNQFVSDGNKLEVE